VGTYEQFMFTYTTGTVGGATQVNMEAEITEIRLIVNDKVQRRCSAAELFEHNDNKGMGLPEDGEITIYFAEPWRRSAQGEDVLAWGMADVNSFQVEIDIHADATTPRLSGKCVRDDVTRPMGPIVKWRKHSVPVTQTGLVNLTTLGKKDAYVGLHAKSAEILDAEIKVGEAEKWKGTAAESARLQRQYGRTPQTGYFHVSFDVSNRVLDTLKVDAEPGTNKLKSFQVDFNMNSVDPFVLITETLGLRD